MIVNPNPVKYIYHSSINQPPQQPTQTYQYTNPSISHHINPPPLSNHSVQPSTQPYQQAQYSNYSNQPFSQPQIR
jgi:hypothetical protein